LKPPQEEESEIFGHIFTLTVIVSGEPATRWVRLCVNVSGRASSVTVTGGASATLLAA